MHRRPGNERTFRPENVHRLDDPARLVFLPPGDVIASLEVRKGMRVADLGAGSGYFTFPLADAVGSDGAVYAVDLQTEMVELLRRRIAERGGSPTIHLSEGSAIDTGLDDRSVDLVFLSNVWHELDNYPAVLAEASRLLRPSGRAAVLDWRADKLPPPGPPAEERIPVERVAQMFRDNRWTLLHSGMIGSYSHLVIGRIPA